MTDPTEPAPPSPRPDWSERHSLGLASSGDPSPEHDPPCDPALASPALNPCAPPRIIQVAPSFEAVTLGITRWGSRVRLSVQYATGSEPIVNDTGTAAGLSVLVRARAQVRQLEAALIAAGVLDRAAVDSFDVEIAQESPAGDSHQQYEDLTLAARNAVRELAGLAPIGEG